MTLTRLGDQEPGRSAFISSSSERTISSSSTKDFGCFSCFRRGKSKKGTQPRRVEVPSQIDSEISSQKGRFDGLKHWFHFRRNTQKAPGIQRKETILSTEKENFSWKPITDCKRKSVNWDLLGRTVFIGFATLCGIAVGAAIGFAGAGIPGAVIGGWAGGVILLSYAAVRVYKDA